MLRMLLLLSAVLFITLLVGGRDAGQLRPGLMARQESAPDVQMPLPAQPEAAAYIPEPVRANSLPVVLPMASPAPSAPAADLAAPAPRPTQISDMSRGGRSMSGAAPRPGIR